MVNRTTKLLFAISIAAPFALWAFSTGPQVRRSGVPVDDGGATCTNCHRGNDLNSPGGRVTIEAQPYKPGIKQTIRVTVFHPEALRWGFQLTARQVSNENVTAGSLIANDEVQIRCDDGRPNSPGTPGPCEGGVKEFAEHVQDATRTGAAGSKTFTVEWMPPANEVGRIVLYAAGNAANGNGNNQGDRIYNTRIEIPLDPTAACNIAQRPVISQIQDAARFTSTLAQNGLFTIKGSNFGTPGNRRIAGAGDIENSRFGRELACIAVEVNGQRVPITYTQQDQINAQIPTIDSTGPVQVRVIANPGRPNELRSDVGTATLAATAPQFFTFNGTSVAALHADNAIAADPTVVPGARTVAPGGVLQLFATGLGFTDPIFASGEIVPGDRQVQFRPGTVTVTIGGTTVPASDILYAGLAPGAISGLYQINVRVPATAAAGNVPVTMSVSGVASAAGTTIPVRNP